MGSSKRSPAAATPPPTTTRSTVSITTTLHTPMPRYRPASVNPCRARRSPARAASTAFSTVGWPHAATLASPRPSVSRQPLVPPGRGGRHRDPLPPHRRLPGLPDRRHLAARDQPRQAATELDHRPLDVRTAHVDAGVNRCHRLHAAFTVGATMPPIVPNA